jgi:hypothetical protein
VNKKQVAQELVKIARAILAKEKTLQELDGAVFFAPKYQGIPFVVAKEGLYKRDPSGKAFREVRFQDAVPELRLKENPDVVQAIEGNWNKARAMVKALKDTGKFRFKVIRAPGVIVDADDANKIEHDAESRINAPFVTAEVSTLGGKERASLIIKVSLQPKSEWENGIFHNSPYFMMHLGHDGVLEQFTVSHKIPKKFRKSRVKSVDDAIKKTNVYISKIERLVKSSRISGGAMKDRAVTRELVKIAKDLLSYDVKLVALIDDKGRVVKRRGEAVEGQGIFDSAGREYAGGFDRSGECYGSIVDSRDHVLLESGKRTPYRVGERYPEVIR